MPRDPEKLTIWRRNHYRNNKEAINKRRREEYAANPDRRKGVSEWGKGYYAKNKDRVLARTKRDRQKAKLDAITAYGGKCTCCGEEEIDFLTIDHVNNDGNVHRKTINGGTPLYRNLRKLGFPKGGFTVLCFNCNIARSLFNTCPHQRKRDLKTSRVLKCVAIKPKRRT